VSSLRTDDSAEVEAQPTRRVALAGASAERIRRAERRPLREVILALVQAVLVLGVLAGAAYVAIRLIRTGPKAERKQRPPQALLVEVAAVRASTERVVVHAMGSAGAAREMALQSRVGGEIVWLTPECVPGGRFEEGAVVAKIDADDYKLAVEQAQAEMARLAAMVDQRRSEVVQREGDVAQRESDLIQAQAALKIELGRQAVAKREFELLGQEVGDDDRDLVLRLPQLQSARATCEAAEAAKRSAEAMERSAEAAANAAEASKAAAEVALRQAQLDLARTTIMAPLNAIVLSRTIQEGSQVAPSTEFARLVGTDEYWVEVSIPVDQLKWVRVPYSNAEQGSPVRIRNDAAWGEGASRAGFVQRLTAALETEGRMARLLVTVPDPLALKPENAGKPRLLLGSYVRVEIQGEELEDVVPLPRDYVRDGDRVWVFGADGTLEIRQVKARFSGRDRVFISDGLADGEQVVVTDIAAPVPGMALRTQEDDAAAPEPSAAPGSPSEAKSP